MELDDGEGTTIRLTLRRQPHDDAEKAHQQHHMCIPKPTEHGASRDVHTNTGVIERKVKDLKQGEMS